MQVSLVETSCERTRRLLRFLSSFLWNFLHSLLSWTSSSLPLSLPFLSSSFPSCLRQAWRRKPLDRLSAEKRHRGGKKKKQQKRRDHEQHVQTEVMQKRKLIKRKRRRQGAVRSSSAAPLSFFLFVISRALSFSARSNKRRTTPTLRPPSDTQSKLPPYTSQYTHPYKSLTHKTPHADACMDMRTYIAINTCTTSCSGRDRWKKRATKSLSTCGYTALSVQVHAPLGIRYCGHMHATGSLRDMHTAYDVQFSGRQRKEKPLFLSEQLF